MQSRPLTSTVVPIFACPEIAGLGLGVHGDPRVERFRMAGLWCLHLYRYRGTLLVDGHTHELRPGAISLVPPGTELEYRFRGRSEHVYAHFSLGDQTGDTETSPLRSRPVSYWPARRFALLEAQAREAVGWFGRYPQRAEVRLWDILWQIVEPGSTGPESPAEGEAGHGGASRGGQAVETLLAAIELKLAGPIRVATLIRELELGLSHNQILRLFRRQTGRTIVEYIRHRRGLRAQHLLRHTSLPVKVVAIQVGVADLQAFNKLMRSHTGVSPRAFRDGEGRRVADR